MNLLLTLFVFLNTPFYRAPIKAPLPQIENNIVWVYFTDKGFRTETEYERIMGNFIPPISDEAIQRRINYSGKVFDYDDLPVYQKYIDEIVNLGAELRTVSYWLNAASFRMPPPLAERIHNLPFVYNFTQVGIHTQEIADALNINQSNDTDSKNPDTALYRRFYGLSYEQNKMLGIPSVFNKGYTGSRVKLAILDTGLKRKHNALKNLKIFKEHDFLGGDNFFISRTPGIIESIPNLSNISLTNTPQLFKTGSNRLFLFYAADTFLNQLPYRGVFYSYSDNQGRTWSNHQPIFITEAWDMSIPTISVSGKDSVVYLAWQDLYPHYPNAPTTKLYLRHFINTVPRPIDTLSTGGKNPNIFTKDTNLYITYTNPDSNLYFRKASIYYITPILYAPVSVGTFTEPIINPLVLVDSLGEIEIFALGQHSQKIYHYVSTDTGRYFNPASVNPISTSASAIQAQITGNTIYLLYKDYSVSPNVKITLQKSTDGGNIWGDKKSVTDDLLTLGDFSFAIKDTIFVTYEKQSNIYLVKSSDFGNTWTEPVLITNDFSYAPRVNNINNQSLLIWLQRGDNNTDYDTTQDYLEQPNHGTRMASIIAGYQPYALVGTAPGVDLLICKTELYKTKFGDLHESTTEEDIWIQGLEWAEREGAQVISSSLGYRSWYVEKDFDGRTIPVSIAAGLAAKRGVIIVSAMGNRDTTAFPWPNPYIVAPGDAIGILTAGGVSKSLTAWLGTGIGPTYDGRIKPDLSALADTAIVVAPDSIDSYEGSIGTSCATALIAGCCAVILEAHPEWNADSVKNALFATSSLSMPNCTLGYGIPNIDSLLKVFPAKRPEFEKDRLADPYPNPYINQNQGKIYFPLLLMRKPATASAKIRIYTISGELIKTLILNAQFLPSPGRYGVDGAKTELDNIGAFWNGENEDSKKVSSGLYFAVLTTSFGQDLKKFAVIR